MKELAIAALLVLMIAAVFKLGNPRRALTEPYHPTGVEDASGNPARLRR